FRARLFELELEDASVEVWAGPLEGSARGRVVAVATDHLLLETGEGPLHIALSAIDAVAER
ncbi:MAG: hypothetical protein R3320_05465, partial [Nitriliruptorales bacterium]|nr:hypothetical protein [Nitriliruptorales bacterium]